MRKLTSFLFMSLDGVVEAPDTFVRAELYADFPPLIGRSIDEQDAVLMGRKTYDEWSVFWPTSPIQPFSGFINRVPKFVVSSTLATADWAGTTILSGPLEEEVGRLKQSEGGTIGVSGSIGLVQSLIVAGLLDELQIILSPGLAGQGRRLVSELGAPIQLDLVSAQSTPTGLQYLVYRPRAG